MLARPKADKCKQLHYLKMNLSGRTRYPGGQPHVRGRTPRAGGRLPSPPYVAASACSTSRPKSIPLTHASVCLSARKVGITLELGSRDRLALGSYDNQGVRQ